MSFAVAFTAKISTIGPVVAQPRHYSGKLIAVEGLDGSGKSTQIYLVKRWLELAGYRVFFTEWNSSVLVKKSTTKGKKRQLLTPTTFSLIHATDFADRYERQILPLLRAGYIVLADRYIFTALARDAVRGVDRDWVETLYSFAVHPDITFYFQVPLEVSLNRILEGRPALKYHEAGLDMGWSTDPYESFRMFQGKVFEQYEEMLGKFGFTVVDASEEIHVQQARVRQIIAETIDLPAFRPPSMPLAEKKSFGCALPELSDAKFSGKLFAIEGADGSGRSTQIAQLSAWLEANGYAVRHIGLRRSNLVGEELETAKQGNVLTHTTLSLFYATDFFDQLVHEMIPALRAGLVVLADRYIYTLMARDIVRGAEAAWTRNLYSPALIPDAVFYFRVGARQLVERNFQKNATLDYWESGMDLGLSRDMFDSFVKYQRLLQAQLQKMQKEYGFQMINGNAPIDGIQRELRKKIGGLLGIGAL